MTPPSTTRSPTLGPPLAMAAPGPIMALHSGAEELFVSNDQQFMRLGADETLVELR